MEFRKRYVAFLNELSELAKTHDELTDNDVRERLHEVINYHFVWDKPMKGFPKRFAMMSLPADRAVAAVVKKFVIDARRIVENAAVKAGASRHALIEDDGAKSRSGDAYDVYLGSSAKVQKANRPAPDSRFASARKSKKKRANMLEEERWMVREKARIALMNKNKKKEKR